MNRTVERFFRYIAIDTQSDNTSTITPTTSGQWTLAELLKDELMALGLDDVVVTDHCFVHGRLPSNRSDYPYRIGIVGHLDTSPEYSGNNIRPIIHNAYDGSPILLSPETGITITRDAFPALDQYIGDDLITSDGRTLLGADGKAGIAEIMTFLEILTSTPSIAHGEIHVMFTPDEETDRGGIRCMSPELFPVDFAITLDGDGIGEINFENFNAAHAEVHINGCSIHPGEGKGKLKNAIRLASEWMAMLPSEEAPEATDSYDGFYHVETMHGNVNEAELYCLIRDFDAFGFMKRKNHLHTITQQMNLKYGTDTVVMTLHDDYKNMSNAMDDKPWLAAGLVKAIEDCGIKACIKPIRGGSDGAWLAETGIASPNLFIGAHYGHGPYEFLSIQAMDKAVEVLIFIVTHFSESQKIR